MSTDANDDIVNGLAGDGVSRRAFMKRTAVGAAVGTVAASGAPVMAEAADLKAARDVPKNAAPIPPIQAPSKWDRVADVVIVGTGGAGLAASVRASGNGFSVITLEKLQGPGGATKESGVFVTYGGSRYQNAAGFALPKFPFDPDAIVDMVMPNYQFTADRYLMRNLVVKGAECIDWMGDQGVQWELDPGFGPMMHCWKGSCDGGFYPRATKLVTDHMYEVAKNKGVQFFFGTAAVALVKQGSRIVGVKARNLKGETTFVRAKKGVLLAAGGFVMNREMLKKYVPSAYRGAAAAYGMPCDTGECTRMGLGAGADLVGLDSFGGWDGGLDYFAEGKGPFHRYLYSGDTQLVRHPWLSIDITGKRYQYFDDKSITGLAGTACLQMSRIGNRGYVIFDSDYEQNIWRYKQGSDRRPITPDMPNIERMPEWLAPHDWRDAVKYAIDREVIKKADTLEELAKKLGFKPPVLARAVDEWNETCKSGEDPLFKFPSEWLVPVAKAPFYGARIGGYLRATHCGLRVDPDMQVLDAAGDKVSGLFAAFHTAGGAMGESAFNTPLAAATSVLGDNGLSWTSGYIAAETIAKENV